MLKTSLILTLLVSPMCADFAYGKTPKVVETKKAPAPPKKTKEEIKVEKELAAEEKLIDQEAKISIKKQNRSTEETAWERIANSFEEQREFLSGELVDVSNDVDVYFSNQQYLRTRNATNLRFANESNFVEDSGYENNFDIALRLKLPRSQDKLQLELDQQVDRLQDGGTNYTDYTVVERTRRENGQTKAGLNYYQKVFDTEVRLTSGLDYKHKLIPWTNIKSRNDIFLSRDKRHYIQIINDFYGESLEGTEHHALIAYNYQLNPRLLFRQTNEDRYRDFDNSLEVSHGFTFFHFWNVSNSIAYSYNSFFKNPAGISVYYLDRHAVNISYRKRLFKRHYYASFTPGIIIPKDKDWEVLTAFQIRLEVYFGNP